MIHSSIAVARYLFLQDEFEDNIGVHPFICRRVSKTWLRSTAFVDKNALFRCSYHPVGLQLEKLYIESLSSLKSDKTSGCNICPKIYFLC